MRPIRDYIVVKVPTIFIDETRYKGLNGKMIMMNVFHQPERNVRCHGICVTVPVFLGQMPIVGMTDASERPQRHSTDDDFPIDYKRLKDIPMEVRPGDKVYFHYNCLLPDRHDMLFNHLHLYSKQEMVNGHMTMMHYYRVKYDLIFAVVRYTKLADHMPEFDWNREKEISPFKGIIDPSGDQPIVQDMRYLQGDNVYRKEIQMIGAYVLVEPDMESWDDISIPIPQTVNGKVLMDKFNKPIMKPKEQWLVTKSQPQQRFLQGWVRHIGSPLLGDELDGLREGLYIHFRPRTDTRLDFEGKEYFRMRQRHINAYVKNKSL